MFVLQINAVYKEKSTGRTCYEVQKALEEIGDRCVTAYGYGNHSESKNCYKIQSKFSYFLHKILAIFTGCEGYFSTIPTLRLINYIKKTKPDLIHLRNVHEHFLNLPLLFAFLARYNRPVVINLHDFWMMTGGCAYYSTNACQNWQTGCNNCDCERLYVKGVIRNNPKARLRDKKKWVDGIEKLVVVGVSKWVMNEASHSIFADKKLMYIYNWVNQDVFYFRNCKTEICSEFGLPKDKYLVLSVSAEWNIGSLKYQNVMQLSDRIDEKTHIVLIGECKNRTIRQNITYIDFIHDTDKLACLYSSCDVYVHFALEDTFGKVLVEAMACGLPTIAYNTTCYSEIVSSNVGYTINKDNFSQLIDAIHLLCSKDKEDIRKKCIKEVNERFNYVKRVEQVVSLYKEMVKL